MDPNYRMNVAAVKKVDPSMDSILDSATHVAMYTFNSKDNKWEKTEVEGAMFLYSRSTVPNHAFIIMNRLNTNNLVEPVNAGLDFQIKEPFLLYKTNQSLIYGIWFYDKNECYRVTSNLEKLVKSLQGKNYQNEKRKDGVGGVDIFSMLSKAQEDFNIRSKPEKTDGKKNSGMVAQKPSVGVMHGLPTPPAHHAPPPHTPQSVMDFFAKASNSQFPTPEQDAHKVGKPPSTILPAFFQQPPPPIANPPMPPGLPPQQGEDKLKPILMRLMSNPVHSVEHIEKQQRSKTPDSKNVDPQQQQQQQIQQQQQQQQQHQQQQLQQQQQQQLQQQQQQQQQLQQQANSLENGMFLHMSSPAAVTSLFGTPPSSSLLSSSAERSMSSPLSISAMQQPALIPPTMFAAPARPDNNTSEMCGWPQGVTSPAPLMAPPHQARGDRLTTELVPLTRNQLLQAITHLIKNDTDFINKLHEAYVKSFNEMLS